MMTWLMSVEIFSGCFVGVIMTCCSALLVTDEIGLVLSTRRFIRLSLAGQSTLQGCSLYSGVT